MATSYTTLLGLALPVTGELAGSWGGVLNNSVTQLVEDSVAGVATASVASGDWTLTTTGSGAANEARCAILIPTGSPGVSRNIIAPSKSKAYIVINQSDAAVVVKGSATTGTTISAGDKAVVAWNGSDFVTVSSGDVDGPASSTNNAVPTFNGTTGKLLKDNSGVTISSGIVTATGFSGPINGTVGATTPSTGVFTQVDIPAQGDLRLQDASGGQYAAIQAPATITSSYTLTLPDTDGDSGQFLQTDGSGVLTWAAVSGGDVSGPGSSTSGNIATFNGTSGKIIQDGGKALPSGSIVGTSDSQTLTNKTLTDPAIIGTILEDVYTISDGAAFEVDPGNGSIQLITLGANRTPKATNFAAGEAITLMVDDGSSYSITWTDSTWGGSGVVWMTDSGNAPTLATTGYTTIVLWKVGTQVYGARVGNA